MTRETFDNLMLVGRGGSGKSELIDFLKHVTDEERLEKYHIGKFEEIDDFPWIHAMHKDEDLWEELGRERKYSKKIGNTYATVDYLLYDFLILKFNQVIREKFINDPEFYKNESLIIEYARGGKSNYEGAFKRFDKDILKNTAIFYIDNTFEESLRRNEVRSTDDDENQTILNHKVPVEIMKALYETHDWYDLTDKQPNGYIEFQGVKIPFVTVWNIPESHDFNVLEERYSPPLKKLWDLYKDR